MRKRISDNNKKKIRKMAGEGMTYEEMVAALDTEIKIGTLKSHCNRKSITVQSKVNSTYLTEAEKKYIDDNHNAKLIKSTAEDLGRSINTIRSYYKKNGYATRSVLSDFAKDYILHNYTYKTLAQLAKRLSVKESLISAYMIEDDIDMRLLNTRDILDGPDYIRPTGSLDNISKHVHQLIKTNKNISDFKGTNSDR